MPLKDIVELQGNLKELSELNYKKLKASILQHGFAFPLNIATIGGKPYGVIDGHQRHRVLNHMLKEGFDLPGGTVPVTFTKAADEREAKELILQAVSQYGKVTDDGLSEFMTDAELELDVLAEFEIPDFDVMDFIDSRGPGDPPPPKEKQGKSQTHLEATCPNCGNVFEVRNEE